MYDVNERALRTSDISVTDKITETNEGISWYLINKMTYLNSGTHSKERLGPNGSWIIFKHYNCLFFFK